MNQKCSVAPEGESIFKDKLLAFVLNEVTLAEYFQINFGRIKYFFVMEAFKSFYNDAKKDLFKTDNRRYNISLPHDTTQVPVSSSLYF